MFSIVIQAGGKSSRMGSDKALRPFLGRPLIQRLVERLGPVGDEILVTTNTPDNYRFLNLPLTGDIFPIQNALSGLYTALSAANQPFVAVVACDMPFASPELLRFQRKLLESGGWDVVIPQAEEALQPFHAVYRREACRQVIQDALQKENWKAVGWLDRVKTRILTPAETAPFNRHGLTFWNLNTPEEFSRAEEIAKTER